MGVDPNAQGFFEHKELIDVLGEVKCWVRDLEEAWTKENDRNRNEVARDKALTVIECDIAARARPCGSISSCPAKGRNGAPPTRCGKPWPAAAAELARSTTACTAPTSLSRR